MTLKQTLFVPLTYLKIIFYVTNITFNSQKNTIIENI